MPFPTYRNRYLPSLTLAEIEAPPDKDRTPIIFPIGAIEQHGPQLPVGVDSMMAQHWIEMMVPHLSEDTSCWVAPPITVGKSNEHVSFPGTLAISKESLYRLIKSMVLEFYRLGFRHVFVLNTHGGNIQVVRATLRELWAETGMQLGVLQLKCEMDLPAQESAYGFHANTAETAWLLAMTPEWVDMSVAPNEYPASIDDPGELRPEAAPAIFSWISSDLSHTGVMGDATVATAEDGKKWIDTGARNLAETIESYIQSIGGS